MAGSTSLKDSKIVTGFLDILNLFNSGGGSGTAVGLSIGTSSVKIVELQRSGKTWKLLHFGIVQLADEVIVNRDIVNSLAVSDSVKTLVAQIKLKNRSVCTSLSGTSLIIKRMTLEVPNMRELTDQIFWEAEQYLPFDISEVVIDYQVLSKEGAKTDILFVAIKKTVLDSYMECVSTAGLIPKIVDADFFALQNLFEANYPSNASEAVAIVDVGASSLKIVVVQQGIPVFTKDSAMGGKNLTAEIQKHLNLSFMDAETLKVGASVEQSTPQEITDLILVMEENFATEIKRAIDFYNASSVGAPVSYILLTGGSSKLPGLSTVVEETVNLPTQLLNPFNAISYDPNIFTQQYLESISALAGIPIGLALRAGLK